MGLSGPQPFNLHLFQPNHKGCILSSKQTSTYILFDMGSTFQG